MKLRLIAILAAIAIGISVVAVTVSKDLSRESEYSSYIDTARLKAEKDIPYMAIQNYKKAFEIKLDDEVAYLEYLGQCKKLGESFYSSALDNYVLAFPTSQNAYELLCEYYYEMEAYSSVIETAMKAREAGAANEKVKNRYFECFYMFDYERTELEEAKSFLAGTAVRKEGGKYGFISTDGYYVLVPTYDSVSNMFAGSASVCDNGKWYVINQQGYKVAVPDKKVDSLSFVNNNWMVCSANGKYGYTDTSLVIPEKLPYDYASNFKNGIAAVKKDGKWGLIDSSFNQLTEIKYQDIILDQFDTCINNDRIFVKENNKYYMIDKELNRVGNGEFQDVKHFASSEPAAVCVNNLWGFVDTNGTMVVEPKYENADSFGCGVAPVCVNSSWGYINTSGESRIESQFDDALPFSAEGIAAVKEGNTWSYIKLLGYCD